MNCVEKLLAAIAYRESRLPVWTVTAPRTIYSGELLLIAGIHFKHFERLHLP
jgi:hypothetical protein